MSQKDQYNQLLLENYIWRTKYLQLWKLYQMTISEKPQKTTENNAVVLHLQMKNRELVQKLLQKTEELNQKNHNSL